MNGIYLASMILCGLLPLLSLGLTTTSKQIVVNSSLVVDPIVIGLRNQFSVQACGCVHDVANDYG